MKSYKVICSLVIDGKTTNEDLWMHGEDFEEGTDEYNAEAERLRAEAQVGFDNYIEGK
tara:strand:+ start:390 stop:563 length:174 start_codon:yes stop_codon:yes gene_type:complete